MSGLKLNAALTCETGSFSCHWDKALVSSHPAGSKILSSSLWLRAIVGVSLRAHQIQLKPP
jgi:hypothetical protein